jgi:hypothetical protein
MSSSQPLITPELLRFRSLQAIVTAIFAAFARLWQALRGLTCGDGQQAVVSAVGPRRLLSIRFGFWPNVELTVALCNAGNGRCDWPAGRFARRHGPLAFRSSQHFRGYRPGQQVVDGSSGLSGRPA